MLVLRSLFESIVQLFYPHVCMGCGSDLLNQHDLLCLHCLNDLPHTHFEKFENNYVENIFRGRIPVKAAYSAFYFSKGQLVQQLIHQLKYRSNREIGRYLGALMGERMLASSRFSNIDYIIPLPLYADKEHKRGYNQATIICEGIEAAMNVPLMDKNLVRTRHTETQTNKHRADRWSNVAAGFAVKQPSLLMGKHVLLVDDVITTGASLEACAQALFEINGTAVSLATIAHATK